MGGKWWFVGLLLCAVGCVQGGDDLSRTQRNALRACPERVTRDERGDPRNMAGQIRYCWPGEPSCFCDRDDDCYAEEGYVACTPPSTTQDAGTVDTGRRDTGVTDTGPRDTGVTDTGTPADAGPSPTPSPGPTVPADTVAYTGTFSGATGRYNARLRVAGLDRDVAVYAPRTRTTRPPLVLAFHGTNGDGSVMFNESGARAMADAQGVVVVAPSSRWLPHGDWDHPDGAETYWETHPAVDPGSNPDLLLVRASIAEAIRAYGVNPDRVYAIGHSNGAFFAYFVAVTLRDRVAAFASSSGGLVRCATTRSCGFRARGETCATLRPITRACDCTGPELPVPAPASGRRPPAYLTHGTDDPIVSVEYTCAMASRLTALGYTVRTALRDGDGHVMPETFAQDAWTFLAPFRRQ